MTHARTILVGILTALLGVAVTGCDSAAKIPDPLPPTDLVPGDAGEPIIVPGDSGVIVEEDAGTGGEDASTPPPPPPPPPPTDYEPPPDSDKPNMDSRWQLLEGAEDLDSWSGWTKYGELEEAVRSLGEEGFVVTTTVEDGEDVLLFAYRGFLEDRYGTRVEYTNSEGLATVANRMGHDGYMVTALIHSSRGYALLGFKPESFVATFDVAVLVTTAEDAPDFIERWGAGGFVVTASANVNGRLGLVAHRPIGTERFWNTWVDTVDANSVAGLVDTMATAGYVVTEIVPNDDGFTLVSLQDINGTAVDVRWEEVLGEQLRDKAMSWSQESYQIQGVVSRDGAFQLVGYRP